MSGLPASRGAVASVVRAAGARRDAASAGAAANTAVAASITMAAGRNRRIASLDRIVMHRLVMSCLGCHASPRPAPDGPLPEGNRGEQTLGTNGWFLFLRPAVNRHFREGSGGWVEVKDYQLMTTN